MKKYIYNGFCELFMNTYDYYIKEGVFKEPEKPDIKEEPKKKKFSLFNKKTEEDHTKLIDNIVIDSEYQHILDTKKKIMEEWFTAKGISFSVLWDFIEFIEFAKRSILYEDKHDRFISFIKEDVDKKEHRYIKVFYSEDISFIFDLYYLNNIERLEIIKTVGEDTYKLIINDEEIDFKDESDIYLINTINYILCRECRRKMIIIYEMLKSVFIL